MAKKIFDRIYNTFMIVLNSIYGMLLTLFGIVCLTSMSTYDAERYVIPFILSTTAIILANVINVVIRKNIKNY